MSKDKVAEKGKVLQTSVQTASNVRITRAAASAARQMPKTTAATTGNLSQRKPANAAKQKKAVKADVIEVVPLKHEANESAPLDPVIRSTSELKQEQTSVEKNGSAPGRPRTRSFAPHNFVFQPLEGLTTYKVTPMTPSRANAFLSPDVFWDFSKSPVNKVEKSSETKEPNLKSLISPSDQGIQELQMSTSLKGEASESDKETSIQRSNETIPVSTEMTVTETKSDDVREQEHDVPYFRNILRSETDRLMSQCLQWDGKFELDIPEDAKDLIRTTIGQTRLLIAERFKQFEGLVDNCEFKRGEKETTCTDLDGFWDMINFQIEDVNKKFDNLQKLQDNKWQPVAVPGKVVKKKTVPNVVCKPKLGAAARAAAQNRLAAVKAAMRDKMKRDGAADIAYQNEHPEVEKVVFEAGFFRIESPVKSFPGSLSKTPRRSSQQTSGSLTTPRSSRRALLQSSSVLCNPEEDTSAKETTPLLKGCHPAQHLEMNPFPTETTLPGGFQSISIVAEGLSPVVGTAEGTGVLENCSSELKVVNGVEEMELSAAEQQGQDITMSSPEKDVLSSDLASIDKNPLDTPMMDGELPFTPVKNSIQKFAAAGRFSDLIVFSPISSSGQK